MNSYFKNYLMAGMALAILMLFIEPIKAKVSTVVSHAASAISPQGSSPEAAFLRQGEPNDLYLPVMMRNYRSQPSIFGVEVSVGQATDTMSQMAYEANVSWVRYNDFLWHEIEETEGTRNWPSRFDDAMIELSRRGLTPMVVVRGTPTWAQKVPNAIGASCGPIKEEALDDFADFMRDAVTRYSVAPYNVKYWELGNQPDVDPDFVDGSQWFGCWGDESDPFYGGGYYAEMLKKVYPVIKEVDPNAKVLIGGLLLACDPSNPPPSQSCQPSHFLEGILQNGGGDYFDMVPYHSYASWGDVDLDWDLLLPSWAHRGGALLGRLDFIRDVLSRYDIEKPIIMNEGALLCHPSSSPCEPEEHFRNDQANYLIRLYTRAGAAGLQAVIWHTLDGLGWRDGGLLNSNQEPRPAYTALKFLASQLKHATYVKELSTESMEGYQYSQENTLYDIYWTNDSSTTSILLPTNATVYNKLGEHITPSGSSVTISFEPIIVVRTKPQSWTIETVDSVNSCFDMHVSVATAANGTPHFSYSNSANTALMYAHRLPSGWTTTVVDHSESVGRHSSIALDRLGRPHIAYRDSTNQAPKHAWWDGTNWNTEFVDGNGEQGWYVSLAIDSNDHAHIAYLGSGQTPKYAYWTGSQWETSQVSSVSTCCGISLALDSSDRAHISYGNSGNLQHAFYNGSQWTIDTVEVGSFAGSSLVGSYSSIAIDHSDNPHISYARYGQTLGGDWPNDLKYAWKQSGGNWQVLSPDTMGAVGYYTSIALDSQNRAHISYADKDNQALKYTFFNGTQWETSLVDSAIPLAGYTSLSLDQDDQPDITYCDDRSGTLKYAWIPTENPFDGQQ